MSSTSAPRRPTADTFMIMFPDEFAEDTDRCHELVAHMEAAYPGRRFEAVQSHRIRPENGMSLSYREPTLIPLLGSAGEDADPADQRDKPSAATMDEMRDTLQAFIRGPAALN